MKKVHFLGIGGSGASAVALIAKSYGFEISGCDKVPNSDFTQHFSKGMVKEGHDPKHLADIDILAVTPAIFSADPDNEEVKVAKEKGIEVLTWQEFMGKYLEKDKFVIAVCGTHGKSTTTAMAGLLLENAGLDPTVELGAIVPHWGTNFRIGKSKYFVTEADEFNDNFLVSHPNITIMTTVEMDHPEYFADFENYKESFKQFMWQTKDKIILNLSDPGIQEVIYNETFPADIIDYSHHLINFSLKILGDFNILNASAVYQLGLILGIEPTTIKRVLSSYHTLQRRLEYLGNYQNTKVYSDFGHHPTEIKLTIAALRKEYPHKKIAVVFQPHMFSRTKALFPEFVNVFKNAPVDQIYILDIYPSREPITNIITSQQLCLAIDRGDVNFSSKKDSLKLIENGNFDVVLFLGAGETHDMARELLTLPSTF